MAILQLVSPLESAANLSNLAAGLVPHLASSGLPLPEDRYLLDDVKVAMQAGSLNARLAVVGQEALGLTAWRAEDGVAGFVVLLFALPEAPPGTAGALLAAAVADLRRKHLPRGIYAELPGVTPDLRLALDSTGFAGVERAIMACALRPEHDPAGVPAGYRLLAWDDRYVGAAAEVIYTANLGTVDAMIIPELQTEAGTLRIVRQAVQGRYGRLDRAASALVQAQDGHLAGVTLVTRRQREAGFTAEIAVLPGDRRRGVARGLMLHSHRALAAAGITANTLGVTAGNPARRLYEALGYRDIGSLSTFVWPRPAEWPG